MSVEMLISRQASHGNATSSTCSAANAQSLRPAAQLRRACRRQHHAQHQPRPNRQRCSLAIGSTSEQAGISLTTLQAELEEAVSAEDYPRAASLRDEMMKLQQDSTAAVTEANRKFYAAFEHCSLQAMKEVWGSGNHVQCLHPAANCLQGREDVLESWRLVLRGEFQIRLENVRIHATQTSGYVTCVEVMNAGNATGRTAATNIFEKQNGEWKMVLHHGGPIASSV